MGYKNTEKGRNKPQPKKTTKKKRIEEEEEEENDEDFSDEEDEDSYGSEDSFIEKEEVIAQEALEAQRLERKERLREIKQQRKQRLLEKGSGNASDNQLDDDDIDLIREAQGKTRVLKKLEQDIDDESVEQDSFRGHRRRQYDMKQDLIQDSSDEDDRRRHESQQDIAEERDLIDDERMTDELDEDVFISPEDTLILEKDVPERLQIKLKNRFNPSQEEIIEESKWVFNKIMHSLQSAKDQSNPNFVEKMEVIKLKIQKLIRYFRIENTDIPFIIRYKMATLSPELTPENVWKIFNLDIEYGKIQTQKKVFYEFFEKLAELTNDNRGIFYQNQIKSVTSLRELKNFLPLMNFYKSYYSKEFETQITKQGKKQPVQKQEFVYIARQAKLDEFSRKCMLAPNQMIENMELSEQKHKPNQPLNVNPSEKAREYMREGQKETLLVMKEMCLFTAIELSSQPQIRKGLKDHIYQFGWIVTKPTEKGKKELDLFHPSYRVKHLQVRLSELVQNQDAMEYGQNKLYGDIFLDVLNQEAQGNITYQIVVKDDCEDERIGNLFFEKMYMLFRYPEDKTQWKFVRREIFEIFTSQNENNKGYKSFLLWIIDEIKSELKEDSERFVIEQAQMKYNDMINQGYFKMDSSFYGQENRRGDDKDIIPQRKRLNVIGAVHHQIDNRNYMTTIAVINKYGDKVHNKDFLNIIPPKQPKGRNGENFELRPAEKADQQRHQEDKIAFQEIVRAYNIDLVVVCADSLEAKRLKKSLSEFVSGAKDGDKTKQTYVIWGRPEIPKLFSHSHYSNKILPNHPLILKKAISLARYEQDPMNEILNLWSTIMNENQALNIDLHPLQKQVNQAQLADALEEINIQTVNKIGIDINLLINHNHFYNQLQFLCGLGPRKANRLIQRLRQRRIIFKKEEILQDKILENICYFQIFGFIKVYVSLSMRDDSFEFNILDQTRIHFYYYNRLNNIIKDCCFPNEDKVDQQKLEQQIRIIIQNPDTQKNILDIYEKTLKEIDDPVKQHESQFMFRQVINELKYPFADPRENQDIVRDIDHVRFSNKELFHCLIDESDRTFREGIIVSATVVRIFESIDSKTGRLACRLENGVDANIYQTDCDFFDSGPGRRSVDVGSIIQGRLHQIKLAERDQAMEEQRIQVEDNFSVVLKCKPEHLNNHREYVEKLGHDEKTVPKEDLVNQELRILEEAKQNIQIVPSFQKRKIQHQRFQNISSAQAVYQLKSEENGDFYFRPSSKGYDFITLTWRFFEENIVHITIAESQKRDAPTIGAKLTISDETYESLDEIVDRYINPCNRSMKEVIQHPKFEKFNSMDELKKSLEKEKEADQTRIPYKFTCLDKYPQYLILGYIPKKDQMVREFIKVKPRGYFFHLQYRYPFQNLINWFKQEQRNPTYQRYVRKAKSPQRALAFPTVQEPASQAVQNIPEHRGMIIDKDNDDGAWGNDVNMNDQGQRQTESPNYNSSANAGGYGRGRGRGRGKPLRRDSPEYGKPFAQRRNSNSGSRSRSNSRSSYRDDRRGQFGDRGPMRCYNCQGFGHAAKDCREQRKERLQCFNCQGYGHMSKDCDQPKQLRANRREDFDEGPGYKRKKDEGGSGWEQPTNQTFQGQKDVWGRQGATDAYRNNQGESQMHQNQQRWGQPNDQVPTPGYVNDQRKDYYRDHSQN